MATATQPAVSPLERFVLDEVSWRTYERLLVERERARRHYRITYDRGRLELMTLSPQHERIEGILARFFWILSEELGVPIADLGSMTMRRRRKRRGLEADRCFYIQNEPQVRGRDRIDLDYDPPPDVAVEIDISRSSLSRMGIYAALKVPEVWCYRDETLRAYHMRPDGEYEEATHSRAFPFLDLDRVADFLRRRTTLDDLALTRAFRAWVRSEVVPNAGNAPNAPQPPPAS
jgi:Uma2 family endonuclease